MRGARSCSATGRRPSNMSGGSTRWSPTEMIVASTARGSGSGRSSSLIGAADVSSVVPVGVFNHVGHCVTDLAASRRFYEELLGFAHQRDLPVPDGPASKLLRVPAPVGMTAVYLERDGFVL